MHNLAAINTSAQYPPWIVPVLVGVMMIIGIIIGATWRHK